MSLITGTCQVVFNLCVLTRLLATRDSCACVFLKTKLGRNLLKLACRHHIFKTAVGKVFDDLMSPSNGPDVALFKPLSKSWPNVNQEAFENSLMSTI